MVAGARATLQQGSVVRVMKRCAGDAASTRRSVGGRGGDGLAVVAASAAEYVHLSYLANWIGLREKAERVVVEQALNRTGSSRRCCRGERALAVCAYHFWRRGAAR